MKMVDDWAAKAAKVAKERDRVRALNLEENARIAKIKDQKGPELFRQLEAWIRDHAEEFNKIRGKKELIVTTSAQKNKDTNQLDSLITVQWSGTRQPLVVTYVVSTHVIKYRMEFGQGEFTLNLGENDGAYFHGAPSYGDEHIDEIGASLLDKLMNPPF
jgi:hypothetical protein